jgi:hypothetical protein
VEEVRLVHVNVMKLHWQNIDVDSTGLFLIALTYAFWYIVRELKNYWVAKWARTLNLLPPEFCVLGRSHLSGKAC